MKISDTIGTVLRNKGELKVLSIAPEQTVYEAIGKMASTISRPAGAFQPSRGRHPVGARLLPQMRPHGPCLQRNPGPRNHDQPGVTVTPEHTVDECMAMMTGNRIRHLPVLRGETVLGVISIGDLVKWVISGQAHTIQALEGYIAGAYPA